MMLIAEIEPNTKPRMTRADKWKKRPCVLQYRAFCDELRLRAKMQRFELSGNYAISFYFAMPESWSKKKKAAMNGTPHQSTPDLDNLLKAINDALLEQDKIVYRFEAAKWWGEKSQIVIRNF